MDGDISQAGKDLASVGSREGGKARARSLSSSERSLIAQRAARARWGSPSVQVATHAGRLRIGNLDIDCAVLEDGRRMISQQTLLTALGRNRRASGRKTGSGVSLIAANLQEYVTPELAAALASPVKYSSTRPGEFASNGYPAELLPAICEVYLDARSDGSLLPSQQSAAVAAEILLRGLARVGVIALVDEATGYQDVRARQALQDLIEKYVAAELRKWTRMFPDEFFKQVYRLNGWQFNEGSNKRTPLVGRWINRYVYEALPPGVLEELRRLNPRTPTGHRRWTHHQFLTADTGNPHLDKHISTVTTLMRASDNKQQFIHLFERAFPPPQEPLPLVIDIGED